MVIASLREDLRQLRLLESKQLDEIDAQRGQFADAPALLRDLVRRGWVTPFQANALLQGHGDNLKLGAYLVLERLGEGGMGQVFKARHRGMNRIVALKVVRTDLTADSEIVGRFYREMEVTSKLMHPNLVHAYDAGPLGATHFLAMEFVDGNDLDQLVRKSGPLRIEEACDFIRQAALGLQAIHEHGLVHRDIKPSNLMIARAHGPQSAGRVKILDLGLAGFQQSAYTKKDANGAAPLTLDGQVMTGSIDYMSPEQALDFHQVDIRSDIYSLGCTLFFALTGRPPFGDGPLAVKLLRHQQAEPPELERFRQDVPPGLPSILQRMLAKRPAERYQTPAQVAEALAKLIPSAPLAAGEPRLQSRSQLKVAALAILACFVVAGLALLAARLAAPGKSTDAQAQRPPETHPEPEPAIDFTVGFVKGRDLQLNGSAQIPAEAPILRLTSGKNGQAGSAFCQRKVAISRFSTQFDFHLTNANADGFAFVIQGGRPDALGPGGGGLGYGWDGKGILQSVAFKFGLYSEGSNMTGLFVQAASPFKGGINPHEGSNNLGSSGMNLHSGHTFSVRINYDETLFAAVTTDKMTGATARVSYKITIPSIVGGSTAHVGFTGGTGGANAVQDILNWKFAPGQN